MSAAPPCASSPAHTRRLATSVKRRNGSFRAVGEAPHLREPWVEMAALCYRQRDWEGTAFFALRALRITERPKTYICEASAWGSLPYDLASLALYETGRAREAIPLLEKAVELEPSNGRLKENLRLMRAERPERVSDGAAKALRRPKLM